jgi:hypothetical protein
MSRKSKTAEKSIRRAPTMPTKDDAIEMLRDAVQGMIWAYEGSAEPDIAYKVAIEAMVRTEVFRG